VDESLNKILHKNTQKQLRENELLEKGVNEDASAFQMEHILEAIVRRCPTEPSWIKSGLGALDLGTNQKAQNWVYLIALDIVENFQCRGLKYYDPRFFE
jgi:predicted transcriptional regulator with HTH domain